MKIRALFLQVCLSVFLSLLAATATSHAAPPTLTSFFPAGAQQGTTVEITASGTFTNWPVQAWMDCKSVRIEPTKEKNKFRVSVAADTAAGVSWVRLHNEEGASELRPFLIGALPEVIEIEPNEEAAKPQMLSALPVIVNGRLGKAGDVDCFSVRLRKGEQLVASLEANRTLGSPMDGILQLLSADGFVLEENNDDHGLDPQLVFTAPGDGAYVLRVFAFPSVPDASIRFAGGDTYIYRLTLTTGGFADHAFPLAVPRGVATEVAVLGWNIPIDAKTLPVSAELAGPITLWHRQLANTLPVLVEPHHCISERELKDNKKPQTLALPATISGCIDPPGDLDVFEFPAKKGQRISFQLDAFSVGSQLDPLLRLTDASGKRLALADDASTGKVGSRDALLTFSAPQDVPYRLVVSDRSKHGSWRHFYRLRAILAEPDYALTVATDRFVLTSGKPLAIPVTIDRRYGFDRALEIVAEGLPDGVTAKPVSSTGAGSKSATLNLEAMRGPVSGAFRIVGRVAGHKDLTRIALVPRIKLPQTMPPLWLTVKK
jgi:hypothetical protein